MVVDYLKNGGNPWDEHENRSEIKSEEEANEWSARCIQRFNDTLRPGERERVLVRVVFDHPENQELQQHSWEKTNLYTVLDPRLGLYDTLACTSCGITAKRYGMSHIKIDSKYRAKAYKQCPPAVKNKA